MCQEQHPACQPRCAMYNDLFFAVTTFFEMKYKQMIYSTKLRAHPRMHMTHSHECVVGQHHVQLVACHACRVGQKVPPSLQFRHTWPL